jgi:hypothetical protein
VGRGYEPLPAGRIYWIADNTMSLIKPKKGYFPITSVHRLDLEQAGFDAAVVDDDTMTEMAEKMAQAYLDNGFWIDLEVIAEALEIPRRKA